MSFVAGNLEKLIAVSDGNIAWPLRVRMNCWSLAFPKIPMCHHSIVIQGKPVGAHQLAGLRLDIGKVVFRAHDPPIVWAARIVWILWTLRPRRLALSAQLHHDDFGFSEIPKSGIEVNR